MKEVKRKLIGIPGYKSENGFFGVGSNHLQYVAKFGIPRIIMPDEELAKIDALYLPGGLDLNPSSYGEVPGFKTTNQDVFKQHFYDHRLKNYIGKMPIIAVCLGFQELCVYFGSKLTQDLQWHAQSSNRGEEGHEVILLDDKGNWKYSNKKKKNSDDLIPQKLSVNSHHHQGVMKEDLADCIQPLAIADEWNGELVEIAKHRTLPIAMCQAHPKTLGLN